MNSSTLSIPVSPWDSMCQRLEPLLGDIRSALGQGWHEILECYFPATDIDASAAVQSRQGTADWHLIQFHPAGRGLDEHGAGVACAPSLSEALTALLDACKAFRCLPTRIVFDGSKRQLLFLDGEALLVSVSRLQYRAVPRELRQRALGTITGLRRFADPPAELLKRVRKWPGLASAVGDTTTWHQMATFRQQMVHLPLPCEWLQSARLLCAACGRPEPGMKRVQDIAAAALSAPSWNHIAQADSLEPTSTPWYVGSDGQTFGFYADAADATADLWSRATREWTITWEAIELGKGHCFGAPHYTPEYSLSEHSSLSLLDRPVIHEIAARPLIQIRPLGSTLSVRADSLSCRSAADIAAIFGIGLPADAKARMLDESARETLIVQDGRWRFTRDGDLNSKDAHIRLHKVNHAGNAVWTVSVPAYKGLLLTHRETGLLVLCADYDGTAPVAIIEGLSPVAAAKVRTCLRDTSEHLMDFCVERLSRADRADFAELLAQALSLGHTAHGNSSR